MDAGHGYTLGEIAAAAGMTARNVRAYQTRGLLPAPSRVGRRSVYHEEHLRRLIAIQRARHGGATLTLIANHLAEGGLLGDELPAETWLPRPREAWRSESMARRSQVDRTDVTGLLHGAWPEELDACVQPLLELGVLVRQGQRLVADPVLAEQLHDLQRRGIPLRQVLALATAAVELAAPVVENIEHALTGVLEQRQEVAVELADLAGCLVSALVRRRMLSGRAEG
jgi:DNA-binding transcriptional MerR regulator